VVPCTRARRVHRLPLSAFFISNRFSSNACATVNAANTTTTKIDVECMIIIRASLLDKS
jgi:hypothetical protein